MSADAQRFASLHLARFMREHGYEGARDAAGELAVIPVADGVGPGSEQLLVELARRDTVVIRPAPARPRELRRQAAIVFIGTRGQLHPGRGQRPARRIAGTLMLVGDLFLRRAQGRPVLWIRRVTLRERRPRDPLELVLVAALRVLARQVPPESVWQDVSARS
jgi:hypothetical protein